MSNIKFDEKVEGCHSSSFEDGDVVYGRFIADASKCENYDINVVAPYIIMDGNGRPHYKTFIRRAGKVAIIDGVEYKITDYTYEIIMNTRTAL